MSKAFKELLIPAYFFKDQERTSNSVAYQDSKKVKGGKTWSKEEEDKLSFIVVQSCFIVHAGLYVGQLKSDCFGH